METQNFVPKRDKQPSLSSNSSLLGTTAKSNNKRTSEGDETKPCKEAAPTKKSAITKLRDFVCCNSEMSKVSYLGLCFMILFTAYDVTENSLSSIFSDLGYYSLGIVYFTFALSSIFAPNIIELVGVRISLSISTLTYALFIGMSIAKISWLFLLASAIVGIGAGSLWVSQGFYVALVAGEDKDRIGVLTGVFWGILCVEFVLGYILAWLVLKLTDGNADMLLWVLFGLSVLAFLMLCFVPDPKSSNKEKEKKKSNLFKDMIKTLKNTFSMLKRIDMLLLIPLIMYYGAFCGYFSAVYTELLGLTNIPLVLICFGITLVIGSFVWGKVYDKISWIPLVVVNGVFTCIEYTLVLLGVYYDIMFLQYIAGAISGFNDALSNTLMNNTLIELFPENPAGTFALYKCVLAISQGASYFYASQIPFWAMQIIVATHLFIGLICYCIARVVYNKKYSNKKTESGYNTFKKEQPKI